MSGTLSSLWTCNDGADMAEYGMLLAMVAIIIIVGVTAFKDQISVSFSKATSLLSGI